LWSELVSERRRASRHLTGSDLKEAAARIMG
jgi:hypothetical protein